MTHWIQCGRSRDGRTSPKTKKYTTKHDSQRQEKYDETQKTNTRKTKKHKRQGQGHVPQNTIAKDREKNDKTQKTKTRKAKKT